MPTDVLIVRVRPGETRIARADAGERLKDFAIFRDTSADGAGQLGGVYLGRVKKVVPALEAAFIDVGLDRDVFLGIAEARPQPHMGGAAARDRISDYVHEGEAILVQVLAAARDAKGAKVTRRISVTGAHCVLTPGDPGVRVSKRIKEEAERNRLRTIVTGTLGGDEGCVLRSGAEGASALTIGHELELLRVLWGELITRADVATPPALLSGQATPAVQFLSEGGFSGLAKIIVDDPAMTKAIGAELARLNALPPGGIVRHPASGDVFVDLGVADEVAELLEPKVALKSGGSIIIEETAAVTTIDVNSGGASGQELALTTNLEAVKEAARHMRLRNLAGLIVIDLMAVRGAEAKGRIVNVLKEALAFDPAGPHVLGTTKGGLLEVTRPRRRAPLSHILLGSCPTCGSGRAETPLTVGLNALDRVLADVWAAPALIPVLRTTAPVIDALKTQGSRALAEMEAKLGQPLDLALDETLAPGEFRIQAAENDR